jgi:hypothetical protein
MKKLTWSILLLLSTFQVKAQAYLGVGSSNYAGALGNIVNPAFFVDGRQKMDLALTQTPCAQNKATAVIGGPNRLRIRQFSILGPTLPLRL